MKLDEMIEQLRRETPAVFAGTELDTYTGKGYRWRTLQNERSKKEVPEDMFIRSGSRKTLLCRDAFLDHWKKKLSHEA
jgi:hypothetical protein